MGYETILPLIEKDNHNVRIIALVNQRIKNKVKVRIDLVSTKIPSIWIEVTENILSIMMVLKHGTEFLKT